MCITLALGAGFARTLFLTRAVSERLDFIAAGIVVGDLELGCTGDEIDDGAVPLSKGEGYVR